MLSVAFREFVKQSILQYIAGFVDKSFPWGKLSAKLTDEGAVCSWSFVNFRRIRSWVFPHPALRATFPQGKAYPIREVKL